MGFNGIYPLVMTVTVGELENHHAFFMGKVTHFLWPLLIATGMLVIIGGCPVVNGGSDYSRSGRLGYPYSPEIFPIQWGASWSCLEFPNHPIAKVDV